MARRRGRGLPGPALLGLLLGLAALLPLVLPVAEATVYFVPGLHSQHERQLNSKHERQLDSSTGRDSPRAAGQQAAAQTGGQLKTPTVGTGTVAGAGTAGMVGTAGVVAWKPATWKPVGVRGATG